MTEMHSGLVWSQHPETVGDLLELGIPVAVTIGSGFPVTTISWHVEPIPPGTRPAQPSPEPAQHSPEPAQHSPEPAQPGPEPAQHSPEPGPATDTTVVAVDGDIDQDAASVLSIALWRALSELRPVCCDLGRVDYFGAAAARTILAAHRFAADMGKDFSLRGVHGITDRVLAVIDPDGTVRR